MNHCSSGVNKIWIYKRLKRPSHQYINFSENNQTKFEFKTISLCLIFKKALQLKAQKMKLFVIAICILFVLIAVEAQIGPVPVGPKPPGGTKDGTTGGITTGGITEILKSLIPALLALVIAVLAAVLCLVLSLLRNML